jgi:decaprenylphospho-beta-D-erythro-pentofuranosid-2-ulose 2-reductase
MNNRKKIVIIGATSAIANQCARLWLQKQAVDLTLVGRDAERLKRMVSDLKVRSPESDIQSIHTDFLDQVAMEATAMSISQAGQVDIVLIAHGSLPDQFHCQNELTACRDALDVNGISPVLWAEAFAKQMAKANHGTLALIGSVAGDRGRKSNYVYGAAKGLVTCYVQGLQHRFSGTGVTVVLIKPGPTDTPMTAHLKDVGARLASAEAVARQIVDGIEAGKPIIYAPKKWWLIMLIVRHLPALIFNKMDI